MASNTPITLILKPRGKPVSRLPLEIQISSTSTLSELYSTLSQRTHFSLHRLRLTKGSDGSTLNNDSSRTISSTSLRNNSIIYVKDLGLQISWRTVFFIEYVGPLLLHPLWLYFLRPYLYRDAPSSPSSAQDVFMWMITLHFLKRELESVFLHRFSLATMPIRNIFVNSGHYWLLAGLNIAYWVYAPTSPTAIPVSPLLFYPGFVLYVAGELANLSTHLTLRNLRSAGGKERGIPHGLGFEMVTCPNYTCEIVSWVGMWLVSGLSWSVLFFIVVGGAQMGAWAQKKEKRYRMEFGDKYKKKRYGVLPMVY